MNLLSQLFYSFLTQWLMSLLIIASGATSRTILETKIIDYDYFQVMIDNGDTVNYPDPTGTRTRAPYSTMTATPGALLFLRESAQC